MPKLDTINLRVKDPAAQRAFYCDALGMTDQGDGCVGYGGAQASLRFLPVKGAYAPTPEDLYWKIALSVPDLDLAYTQLTAQGIAMSEPRQFRDVGYLAHITDPEGFAIELLDHHFKGEGPKGTADPSQLGGGAHLSLLTLRAAEIETLDQEILAIGMQPLSVQDVSPYGFTLYFYAFTDEAPPDADLTAVENRTWVYQRPFTVLEIQHAAALQTARITTDDEAGYAGAVVTGSEVSVAIPSLQITGTSDDLAR
ncbi:MAG: VOC family protein [Pseudomonadota bacterium]